MSNAKTLDSITKIIRKIPERAFEKDSEKSFGYFYRDLLLALLCVAGIASFQSWPLGIVFAILLGCVLTGLFVIGHDCGHRSFSKNKTVCNAIGHFCTSLTFWPFHVWRLSHDLHHNHTHHIEKEIAWRPLTVERFKRMRPIQRWIYRTTRHWLLFFGSFFFTYYFIRDGLKGYRSKYFSRQDWPEVRFSLFVTGCITSAMILASLYWLGFYGFICLIVIPQIVFQIFLSTFTFFHHTQPEHDFMNDSTWTMAKAQLECSIHVSYPWLIEWFTHDINWHIPHHVCVGIPHYNLRMAHSALKQTYPESVQEKKFGLRLILRTIGQCQLVTSTTDPTWTKIPRDRPEQALTHSLELKHF